MTNFVGGEKLSVFQLIYRSRAVRGQLKLVVDTEGASLGWKLSVRIDLASYRSPAGAGMLHYF